MTNNNLEVLRDIVPAATYLRYVYIDNVAISLLCKFRLLWTYATYVMIHVSTQG